ncbi:CTD kinase subunit gamma CTK3-domain-containing protein [Pisolithus marmoratus]|nr:CTD kinase subunit gamma CTK3-domain-containing protein [Pisolithus marmoratus]
MASMHGRTQAFFFLIQPDLLVKCRQDLWECVMEECQKSSINHRSNILYFLDSLSETSLLAKAHQQPPPVESSSNAFYVDYVVRDLAQIVECVVPVGRQGLPNLASTKQIPHNWRTKRVVDPEKVDEAMQMLTTRQSQATEPSGSGLTAANQNAEHHLLQGDVVKLQTQVQSSTAPGQGIPYNPYRLTNFLPLSDAENADVALDIEFDNRWETTSDWNEDDRSRYGGEGGVLSAFA